jgi:hypothetical protein
MASTSAQTNSNIVPRFAEMTPYQLYLQQIRGGTDGIRTKVAGLTYIPPQFGGLTGQLETLQKVLVIQIIDFDIQDAS